MKTIKEKKDIKNARNEWKKRNPNRIILRDDSISRIKLLFNTSMYENLNSR